MALVAARAVQGVGAAAMFATTLPLHGSVYRGSGGLVTGVAVLVPVRQPRDRVTGSAPRTLKKTVVRQG